MALLQRQVCDRLEEDQSGSQHKTARRHSTDHAVISWSEGLDVPYGWQTGRSRCFCRPGPVPPLIDSAPSDDILVGRFLPAN